MNNDERLDLRKELDKPCWGCKHAYPVEIVETESVGIECRFNPPTVLVIGAEITQTFPRADIRCGQWTGDFFAIQNQKDRYSKEILDRLNENNPK